MILYYSRHLHRVPVMLRSRMGTPLHQPPLPKVRAAMVDLPVALALARHGLWSRPKSTLARR